MKVYQTKVAEKVPDARRAMPLVGAYRLVYRKRQEAVQKAPAARRDGVSEATCTRDVR